MKVVPQIITFLIIIAIGWYAYERHEAFHVLVNDIADYSGFTRQVSHQTPEASQPQVTAPVAGTVQSSAPKLSPEEASDKSEQLIAGETPEPPAPKPAQERIIWPDEVESAITLHEPPRPEQPVISEEVIKELVPPAVPVVKPLPESNPSVPVEAASPGEQLPPQAPAVTLTETVDTPDIPVVPEPTNNTTPEARDPAVEEDQRRGEDQEPALPAAENSRKQQALTGLAAARVAWHEGDHDKSIMLYSQLAQEFQNHPDFAGELGNIYFSKGQTELAVNAYSEAFLRLLKNKDYSGAEQLLSVIYNIDQEQAALLREYFPQ